MPRRTDLESILIIGAGPIVIGQACEFDYSGAQACKALKSEGYRIVLVNSNPATIMTDPELADATYIEPITPDMVAKIIARERPQALLPTMGGQTALNIAIDAPQLGRSRPVGCRADRRQPGRPSPRRKTASCSGRRWTRSAWLRRRSRIARSLDEAVEALESVGLPAIIRPSFTSGRHRRRGRLQPAGIPGDRARRAEGLSGKRSADRGIGPRVERIRDGGGPRPGGQLHHRVLDREYRSDGHPYRRLRLRRAGFDPDRQRISG